MTKPSPPSLDPAIAAERVDPDALAHWFAPFEGYQDLLTDYTQDPDATRVDAEAARIVGLCGASRSRIRAGVAAFALVLGLAAKRLAWTEGVSDAVRAALRLSGPRLAQRLRAPADYAEKWLAGDEGPISSAEANALQIIAHVARHGATVGARWAIYDLLGWYRQGGQAPDVVAVNAMAVVVGLVDAVSGKVSEAKVSLLLGHDYSRMLASATFDAEGLVKGQGRYRAVDHLSRNDDPSGIDFTRTLQSMRKREAYGRIEAGVLRELTAGQRSEECRMRFETFANDSRADIFGRFNNPPKRKHGLYAWRSTYWRMRNTRADT